MDEKTLAVLLSALPGTPRLVASGNFATPYTLLELADAQIESFALHMLNAQAPIPDRDGIVLETAFVGPGMRNSPRLRYFPCRLSVVPDLLQRTLPPDVVLLHTSTPRRGAVSLGIEVNILPAAIEAVRRRGGIVIAQMNPRMPFTFGDAVVPLDVIDYGFEVDARLPSPDPVRPSPAAAAIGERVAHRVSDGATLQAGIGAIPDAVIAGLRDRRELGVWTEMFSDGVLDLEHAGVLRHDEPLTASFLFGSRRLYDWVHENDRVHVLRVEKTNNPALIAAKPAMTSVNTALQVDLYAQANATRIGHRIYSGIGGQTDFIVGALHSPGGQALLALQSWHPRADVSTIVPMIDEATTSSQMSAVVTEHGVAELFGYDERAQARHLIEQAAHPDAREDLWEEAAALGLA
ncbi:acetyl-CoA hydrolase/transferase family protein [Mumia flava]|uniref:acetyl-CoA hydrolase/transferase family protein n=1 Tax=Mumia flava TaxID=1348852 RepID=UPI001FE2ED20|nr:acetyl-CoA hydrolase/transferase C-terminal domain-containing protein [Mumia flava]